MFLRDHRRGLAEVDREQPRRARRERLHRDLDPGREDAAHVLALRRDDVEVRRGAEVDDDARRAVPLAERRPRSRSGRARPRAGRRSAPGSPCASRGRGRAASTPSPLGRLLVGPQRATAPWTRARRPRPSRDRRARAAGARARRRSAPTRSPRASARASSSPSKSPMTVCVFPTSIARSSMRRAYFSASAGMLRSE